jgi:DNA-binding NarL/FixJ family response regulator
VAAEAALPAARRARLTIAKAAAAPVLAAGRLTAREAEVLRALAEGPANREIGARLFISQKTVAAHLANIFDKLPRPTRQSRRSLLRP